MDSTGEDRIACVEAFLAFHAFAQVAACRAVDIRDIHHQDSHDAHMASFRDLDNRLVYCDQTLDDVEH